MVTRDNYTNKQWCCLLYPATLFFVLATLAACAVKHFISFKVAVYTYIDTLKQTPSLGVSRKLTESLRVYNVSSVRDTVELFLSTTLFFEFWPRHGSLIVSIGTIFLNGN